MTVIADAERLTRLGLALRLRDVAIDPVVAAVAHSKSKDVVVGISAHGGRFDVVMPFDPEALAAASRSSSGGVSAASSALTPAAAASSAAAAITAMSNRGAADATTTGSDRDVVATPMTASNQPATTPGAQLRLRVDGDRVSPAITTPGAIEPQAAVDELAPEPIREAWLDLVSQFCSVAGGRIVARTCFIDGSRAFVEIRYPARARTDDLELAMAIDQLAGDLDVSAMQRKLWTRIHPDLGRGREILVTTGVVPGGVSSQLGIAYPVTEWSLAVRVAQGLTLDAGEAAAVPRQLGELAGILDSDRLVSLELVLGPNEPPDLLLWTRL